MLTNFSIMLIYKKNSLVKNQTSSFALKCEVGNHPQDLNSIFNNHDKKPSLNSLLCEDYFTTYDIFSAT